ncbi:MAG: hypothetical protein CFE34_03405 [Rhodobacteraceae bacterium PARR1]|nr:MAG: hypothetical protein CFE34_03405 [Rhodobacteraceae bacterium PARR1]
MVSPPPKSSRCIAYYQQNLQKCKLVGLWSVFAASLPAQRFNAMRVGGFFGCNDRDAVTSGRDFRLICAADAA